MSSLTKTQLNKLLTQFKEKGETVILEEGKEKSELINAAEKRGILIKGSRDLGVLKTIFCFCDEPNENNDLVPSKEFLKIFPQVIGKPMDYNHEREIILGFYVDYKYILKNKKAITYAVFFKSNYPKLWKKAKKLQKEGKLSSSFEIWSSEKSRKYTKDGVCSLHNMEIAGGALIFEENGVVPAFKNAKVLSMAKKEIEQCIDGKCLTCASKYKDADIITAGDIYKEEVEKNLAELKANELTDKEEEKPQVIEPKEVIEPKKEEIVPKEPEVVVNPKITCSSCSEEFEILPGQLTYKCPKCFSILDSVGTQKYPPQLKDFRLACPNCSSNNWLILKNEENKTILKCQSEICNKTFEIEFAQEKKNELLDKTAFLYTNTVSCIQCGTMINIAGSSQIKAYEVSCPKCKLTFNYNKTKAIKDRQIIKITEIEEPKIEEEKSSKKGGEEDVKIPKEIVEKVKEEEKAPKVEAPKEEVKKEEVPKVEEKVVVEEVKVEAPKVESPIEKVELAPEAPKKASIARRAVKKIMALKKDLRTAKKIQERKEITLKTAIKKVASQLILARAEVKKIKKEADEKIELYKEEAKTILKRRDELGKKYVGDLSDKDILNDDKFKTASLEKEVTLLKASREKTDEIVGDKSDEDINSEDEKLSKEIDAKAFTK